MKTTGNTIYIPGATSGIGLGLAERFNAAGNTVIVGGRREERLKQIKQDHPDIDTVVVDTTDPRSISASTKKVLSAHADLNVLIPMAGIMLPESLVDLDFLGTAVDTVNTNVLGPIRLLSAFLPQLKERPNSAVVFVSSGLAFVPRPITPTYNATKAAIHAYAESVRVQLADTSVQVIELVPPGVQTALMNQEGDDSLMPLDDFLDEAFTLLATQPDAHEILVERVKSLRFSEREGRYDAVLTAMSSH